MAVKKEHSEKAVGRHSLKCAQLCVFEIGVYPLGGGWGSGWDPTSMNTGGVGRGGRSAAGWGCASEVLRNGSLAYYVA